MDKKELFETSFTTAQVVATHVSSSTTEVGKTFKDLIKSAANAFEDKVPGLGAEFLEFADERLLVLLKEEQNVN